MRGPIGGSKSCTQRTLTSSQHLRNDQEPRPWTPANPRRAFTEADLEEVELLTVDEDPRLALTRPADLLVIGPRGKGILKAMHVGSTAEWLMTSPPSPLVVARHGRPTKSVVVCHDGSANACAATLALSRMPWISKLIVTVVAVKDGRADVDGGIEFATRSLERVGAKVHNRILRGEPIDELLRYLGQHEPDLVVLGTSRPHRHPTSRPRLSRQCRGARYPTLDLARLRTALGQNGRA